MRPIVVGCNHKTAPLELREKLTLDEPRARQAMDALRRDYDGCEVVVLSTCNRSEFYVARPTHARPREDDMVRFLAGLCSAAPDDLVEHLYVHDGRNAVDHLFRVASSLDSMVVGETQILNQVKQALAAAEAGGAVGKALKSVFQWALHVAKEVHTETQISSGQVSVGSVAVRFARQIFSRFDDKTVLMIGAGEMGKLTLQHVLETGPKRVLVANRTPERAQRVAPRYQAEPAGFDRLSEFLARADVVISSTGASEPVLTVPLLEPVLPARSYRPLVIIDIAVPRDVEPAVAELDNVYLYNIDDLQTVVDASVEDRQAQLLDVDRIIAEHVDEFVAWRDSRSVGPVLDALRGHIDEILAAEADWAKPKLTGHPERDAEILDQLLHRVIGKLMHRPSRTLRQKATDGSVEVYIETLRRLFDLPEIEEVGDEAPKD
ncbi:MAG: glutamyl-tRNA reductase [Phycisphaerae bacterium]|nr:glutamyl-tRNA reductase [Phycisphaerae bacterium]